jgi:hypothetical protein
MRTITELKRLEKVAQEELWALQRELQTMREEAKAKKQATCKHPRRNVETRSAIEPMHMTHPYYWNVQVCAVCGKELAFERETKEWVEAE